MVTNIGRLCVKVAGRDAGQECLIVDELSGNLVLVDGNTRRRKCNIAHLEFLPHMADIKKGASHEEVAKELAKLGVDVSKKERTREKKPAEKKEEPKLAKKGIFKTREKKEAKPKEGESKVKAKPKKVAKTK